MGEKAKAELKAREELEHFSDMKCIPGGGKPLQTGICCGCLCHTNIDRNYCQKCAANNRRVVAALRRIRKARSEMSYDEVPSMFRLWALLTRD